MLQRPLNHMVNHKFAGILGSGCECVECKNEEMTNVASECDQHTRQVTVDNWWWIYLIAS